VQVLPETSQAWLRYWKILSLASITILALISGAYAYWRVNTQPSSAPYSIAVFPPLELRLELDKTEFQQGEVVVVRVSLTNIGDKNITLSFPSWGDIGFHVKDNNGELVDMGGPISPGFLIASVRNLPLPAGSKIERVLNWTQQRTWIDDPSLWSPGEEYPQVPPGTYKIVARTLTFSIYDSNGFVAHSDELETPQIRITIK
jgi:hypothetical protein